MPAVRSLERAKIKAEVTGDTSDRSKFRARVIGLTSDSQSFFASAAVQVNSSYDQIKKELDRFPKQIYFGSHHPLSTQIGWQMASFYGTIGGNFESGYTTADWQIDYSGPMNYRNYGAISTQIPALAGFFPSFGNDDTLKPRFYKTVEVLNQLREGAKALGIKRDEVTTAAKSSMTLHKVLVGNPAG